MRKFRDFIIVVLSLLLTASCSNNQPTSQIIGAENLSSPSPNAPFQSGSGKTPSVSLPIAVTETHSSNQPEPQPTASLMPSWTPLPTLSSSEKREKIIGFLTNNTDCKLPCWLGITPGEVSLPQARHYLSQFADRIVDADSGFGIVTRVDGIPEEIASSYTSSNDDEIISLIHVQPGGTAINHQLYQLFVDYGKPEEVVLDALPNSPAGTPWFYLVLFYPQKGFSATFTGPAELENDKVKIKICPQGIDPMLILVKPNSETLTSLKNLSYGYPPDLPSISSYPEMSIDLLYNNLEGPQSCFIVSVPGR